MIIILRMEIDTMKRRTLKNMDKATKMIVEKGYDWNTANEIAIQCFDRLEQIKNGMNVEWFINKIAIK